MKKKTILLVALLVIIIAVALGAFMWNKGPVTVDGQKGTAITAEALTGAFGADEAKANTTYLNKVMEVTGKVSEVTKNQDGKTVLLLESADPLSGVQCTMREVGKDPAVGNTVTVKGFCNGYTMVVLLSDCVMK